MTSVNDILGIGRNYMNVREGSERHKYIVDRYNGTKPIPQGYKLKYTDDWCAGFISFLAIEAGVPNFYGRECGVQRFVGLFQSQGIWIEDGRIVPRAGDIIVYNWDDSTQDNNGWADHIGIVENVRGSTITTIEGNMGNRVARRQLSVGHGNIRGYARPKYSNVAPVTPPTKPSKSDSEIAKEVCNGKWGIGEDRIARLKAAGYNPSAIQTIVNQIAKGNSTPKPTPPKPTPPKPTGNGDIRAVQTFLKNTYGFNIKADGYYGSATKAAINKAAQTEMNRQFGARLSVDGIFGGGSHSAWGTVRRGARGNITRCLQAKLICLGYSVGGFDGIFGGGLEVAIRKYQGANGLSVDGLAGKNTARSLFNK